MRMNKTKIHSDIYIQHLSSSFFLEISFSYPPPSIPAHSPCQTPLSNEVDRFLQALMRTHSTRITFWFHNLHTLSPKWMRTKLHRCTYTYCMSTFIKNRTRIRPVCAMCSDLERLLSKLGRLLDVLDVLCPISTPPKLKSLFSLFIGASLTCNLRWHQTDRSLGSSYWSAVSWGGAGEKFYGEGLRVYAGMCEDVTLTLFREFCDKACQYAFVSLCLPPMMKHR